jgi:molybdopterin molybdotransferase
MVSLDRALKIVQARAPIMPSTLVPLKNSRNCFLAERVIAAFDAPRFDNSAVDGYGVRLRDIRHVNGEAASVLTVSAIIRAGGRPPLKIKAGTSVKLLTGAPVPDGVDAIFMQEEVTEIQGGQIAVAHRIVPGQYIRRKGAEFRKGDVLLPAGTRITPGVIGLLASQGIRTCRVYSRPAIRIVVTGDEIAVDGRKLRSGQVHDSISPALMKWCENLGACDIKTVRCADSSLQTTRTLRAALSQADLILTAGGISVGDYDLVEASLKQLGVQRHFSGVAIKPGKPIYFGSWRRHGNRKRLVFGLPGNPVSALVTFHLFVKPALARMMGASTTTPERFHAVLASGLEKTHDRHELVRGKASVRQGNWQVSPIRSRESYMLGGLARADCLIHFPVNARRLRAGRRVLIELLSFG